MLSAAAPGIVYATDRKPVLPLLRESLALNEAQLGGTVVARELDWSRPDTRRALVSECGQVDVLVCVELLYAFPDHASFEPLQDTMAEMIGDQTRCLFGYQDRGLDCGWFFEKLEQGGIQCKPLNGVFDAQATELPPAGGGFQFLELTKR
eukprot:TRINITY_DN20358_c0_g1_i5.p2 TRINITY_DN20358_c0_g1~~TRINITY_DN20358_c0_g1_i5.p2  ORF type:complete len:150 (-),score=37.55 TRINITY_DN20358_c0_g1_i5:281-730(-)